MPKFTTAAELQELGELVDLALNNCTAANLPNICAMTATPEGRATVRQAIIRNCVAGGISVASGVLDLEREYSFTSLD